MAVDTENLGKMLDNLINSKNEQAEVHFHDFLKPKMQEVFHVNVKSSDDSDTNNEE